MDHAFFTQRHSCLDILERGHVGPHPRRSCPHSLHRPRHQEGRRLDLASLLLCLAIWSPNHTPLCASCEKVDPRCLRLLLPLAVGTDLSMVCHVHMVLLLLLARSAQEPKSRWAAVAVAESAPTSFSSSSNTVGGAPPPAIPPHRPRNPQYCGPPLPNESTHDYSVRMLNPRPRTPDWQFPSSHSKILCPRLVTHNSLQFPASLRRKTFVIPHSPHSP